MAYKGTNKPILYFIVATVTTVYNDGSNINTLMDIPYTKYIDNHLKTSDEAMGILTEAQNEKPATS